MATRAARKVEAGSGNVFVDLRVPNPGEAQAKAKLGGRICELLAAKRLSRPTGIDQPKVSALVRGKLNGFSTDRLV